MKVRKMPRQIPARTIKISKRTDGVLQARLSPDLVNSLESDSDFAWYVDRKHRKLILEDNPKLPKFVLWKSNKKSAKSRYMGATSFIKEMGLNPDDLVGKTFDVKVFKGGKVMEVQF